MHFDALPSSAAATGSTPISTPMDPVDSVPLHTLLALPDSPGATLSSSSTNAGPLFPQGLKRKLGIGERPDTELAQYPASATDKFIYPGQTAPTITAKDKVEMGLLHGVSSYSILGWFVSSGIDHWNDDSPHYGVDKGAYGERLAAAAVRGYTEEILKDSVLASVLHQDPRYYKMGPGHSLRLRAAYAASRILVTRNDKGRLAPNYTVMGGNLLGAALTNAYYPAADRSFGQTARTFGAAMYGGSISLLATEFLSQILEKAHLRESH